MAVENWRAIPGFEGSYEVSDLGRVRSIARVIQRENNTPRRVPECVLKPGVLLSGHQYVFLGQKARWAVHRLVLHVFIGPVPAGCEVLHLNHNPKDNRLVNLRYGTRSENLRMDYQSLRRRQATPVVAVHPDGRREYFVTATEAGLRFGVTQPAMSRALRMNGTLRNAKVRIEKYEPTS